MKRNIFCTAFSLVEMSLVLVILGLLVGSIVAGQSLIHISELKSVPTDFAKYENAYHTFSEKYASPPGDFSRATAYWGKNATLCSTDTGTAATPGTCNGNGNGTVNFGEILLFWHHMALAGMVEGNFTPTGTATASFNVPGSKVANGSYFSIPRDTVALLGSNTEGYTGEPFITIGTSVLTSGSITATGAGGVLTNPEAHDIDLKMDDGVADTGAVRSNLIDHLGALVSNACAPYLLNDTTAMCVLAYKLN